MPNMRLLLRLAGIAATSRSTRVFYDRVSPFYELLFTDHLSHIRTMAAVMREEFPHRIKVLDIACGTGALSRRLEEKGFCVTGLDFSFQSLCRLNHATKTFDSSRLMRRHCHSAPPLSMWLLAWERGAIFPILSVFCMKSAECFARTAAFSLATFLQNWEGCSQSPRAHLEGQLSSSTDVLCGC